MPYNERYPGNRASLPPDECAHWNTVQNTVKLHFDGILKNTQLTDAGWVNVGGGCFNSNLQNIPAQRLVKGSLQEHPQ